MAIRKITCAKCHGGGAVLCPVCDGEEKDENGKKCRYCAGCGIIICQNCDGSGEIEVEISDLDAMMGY